MKKGGGGGGSNSGDDKDADTDHDDVSDATYASILLQHAKTLWDFAINHPGIYSHSVPAASGFYRSAFTVLCLLTFSVLQFSAC